MEPGKERPLLRPLPQWQAAAHLHPLVFPAIKRLPNPCLLFLPHLPSQFNLNPMPFFLSSLLLSPLKLRNPNTRARPRTAPPAAMAPTSKLSDSDVALQAAADGNLGLLKKMANKVNLREAKDDRGRNALHLAAARAHLSVCKFLVEESGLDVNSTSTDGSSPLHFAGIEGRGQSVLRYLVGCGGDPGMPNLAGRTPLHDATLNGNCEAVRVLLSMGVDVDALTNRGMSPLHMAATMDYDKVLKMLLDRGADPNKVFDFDYSPLVLACSENSLKCSKLLVEAGADVNFVGASGQSVLMMAVRLGFFDIVKFLLEAGADPNIAGKDGKIPIMVAATVHRKRELVKILFPLTRPIPFVPDWSIDGVIRGLEYPPFEPQMTDDPESKGKEAFEKGQYLAATNFYGKALVLKPFDATLFAKRSLCWLRLRDGDRALLDAQFCKILRPRWAKTWYREGAALSSLKNHKGAVDAFLEALKLRPSSRRIKKALRKAKASMKSSGSFEELDYGA